MAFFSVTLFEVEWRSRPILNQPITWHGSQNTPPRITAGVRAKEYHSKNGMDFVLRRKGVLGRNQTAIKRDVFLALARLFWQRISGSKSRESKGTSTIGPTQNVKECLPPPPRRGSFHRSLPSAAGTTCVCFGDKYRASVCACPPPAGFQNSSLVTLPTVRPYPKTGPAMATWMRPLAWPPTQPSPKYTEGDTEGYEIMAWAGSRFDDGRSTALS